MRRIPGDLATGVAAPYVDAAALLPCRSVAASLPLGFFPLICTGDVVDLFGLLRVVRPLGMVQVVSF